MRPGYKIAGRTPIPHEYALLAISRVRPFLNTEGLASLTIEQLLCEAYIQGLRDAATALLPTEPTT
jgi:hypothetical protein